MPKKKGKKGKAEDPEVVALRLAQEAAAAAEVQRHEEELRDKEAWLIEQETDLKRREDELTALENDMMAKLEGLDAEVLLRARSGIAAAEAREAATERNAVIREEAAEKRLSSFRRAEMVMRLRDVKISAREVALEGSVKGVTKHLETTIAAKCSFGRGQGVLDAQNAEVEACMQGLYDQKDAWAENERTMGSRLQAKEREARDGVKLLETRLVEKYIVLQRRMALRVKEVEALVASEREEAVKREALLDAREAKADMRDTELNILLKEVQSFEKAHQDPKRPSTAQIRETTKVAPLSKYAFVPDMTSVLHSVRRLDAGDAGTDPREEARAVAAALEDVQRAARYADAAEELAQQPLPSPRVVSSSSSSSASSAGELAEESVQFLVNEALDRFVDAPLDSSRSNDGLEAEVPGDLLGSPAKVLAEAPVAAPCAAPGPAAAPAPAPGVAEAPAAWPNQLRAAAEAPAPAPPTFEPVSGHL